MDSKNCGACGTACKTGEVCSKGACKKMCGSGLAICGFACTSLQTDAKNCGACGTVCAANKTCSSGKCVCQSAFEDVFPPTGYGTQFNASIYGSGQWAVFNKRLTYHLYGQPFLIGEFDGKTWKTNKWSYGQFRNTIVYKGTLYIFTETSSLQLIAFDGSATKTVKPPKGYKFSYFKAFMAEYKGKLFIYLLTQGDALRLMSFDGTTFKQIAAPASWQVSGSVMTVWKAKLLVAHHKATSKNASVLLAYDGSTWKALPFPAGDYQLQGGRLLLHDGRLHARFTEKRSLTTPPKKKSLLAFDGTTWKPLAPPAGYRYVFGIQEVAEMASHKGKLYTPLCPSTACQVSLGAYDGKAWTITAPNPGHTLFSHMPISSSNGALYTVVRAKNIQWDHVVRLCE